MGKIESKTFCFFHDMKSQLYGGYSHEQLMNLNCNLAGAYAADVADKNPDFEKADALYAFSAAMSGPGGTNYAAYEPYLKKYDKHPNWILLDLMPALEDWLHNASDFNQEAHGILALLYIECGDTERGNEILNLFLQHEERGMKIEPGVWLPLCALSGFEEWHDNKYGNPIIGNTSNHNNGTNGSAPAPNYGGTSNSSSGGCYIATAVYGSYDCPEVWTLRRFRDYSLDRSWYGRAFIKLYYAVSPSLVKWFGDAKWFKRLLKGHLDRLVLRLRSNGVDNAPYID